MCSIWADMMQKLLLPGLRLIGGIEKMDQHFGFFIGIQVRFDCQSSLFAGAGRDAIEFWLDLQDKALWVFGCLLSDRYKVLVIGKPRNMKRLVAVAGDKYFAHPFRLVGA